MDRFKRFRQSLLMAATDNKGNNAPDDATGNPENEIETNNADALVESDKSSVEDKKEHASDSVEISKSPYEETRSFEQRSSKSDVATTKDVKKIEKESADSAGAQSEFVKSGTGKTEVGKTNTESCKTDNDKIETGKTDTIKPDTVNPDTCKTDSGKTDTDKADSSKPDKNETDAGETEGICKKDDGASTEGLDGFEMVQPLSDIPEDKLLQSLEQDDYMYYYENDRRERVTKSHYIPKADRGECQTCGVPFSLLTWSRPRHCRRCGDVFCRSCLTNNRRLNIWAQPDNKGTLCKVCPQCYDEAEVVMFGVKRSLTRDFADLRQQCKEERRRLLCDLTIERRNGSVVPVFWREQFEVDIPLECQRLLKGFKSAVGSSETYKTLHEMADKFIVPSWQKAKFWMLESSVMTCRQCGNQLKSKKYRNCRVCALALCRKCSFKELLVYFVDGRPPTKDTNPKLAIIKVRGSPEIEPRYSLRLNICTFCRSDLARRQTLDPCWLDNLEKPSDPDLMSRILEVDQTFRDLMSDIHQGVERLYELGVLKKMQSSKHSEEVKPGTGQNGQSKTTSEDESEKNHEAKTLMQNVQEGLDRYYKVYQSLHTSTADLMKATDGRKLKLASNYIQARKNSYLQLRSKGSTHRSEDQT